MKILGIGVRVGVTAAIGALIAAQPAQAGHRVVIDPNLGITTQDCSVSAPASCAGVGLGFSINIGGSLVNTAFLYTGGVVSLGSALPSYSGGSTPGSYGSSIVSAGQGSTDDGSPYYGVLDTLSGAARITYFSGGFVPGSDTADPVQVGLFDGEMITITDDSAHTGHAGDFTLQFTYDFTNAVGHKDVDNNNAPVNMTFTQESSPPNVSGFEGFTLGGSSTSRSIDQNGVLDETFVFRDGVLVTNTPGVPEPATWACLLTGFGLIGGTARRSRFAMTKLN